MIEWRKIRRVISGVATEEECKEVEAWKKEDISHECLFRDAVAYYGKNEAEVDKEEVEVAWKRFAVGKRMRTLWKRALGYAAVAAVLGGVAVGGWYFAGGVQQEAFESYDGVTLVLSDGSVHGVAEAVAGLEGFVAGGEGELCQKDKGAEEVTEVKYNELIVPRHRDYTLVLADGSRVVLNSGSKLRFPETFRSEERRIYLEGEAYFEVTHRAGQPFIVSVGGADVRVLGTTFNVKAYREENVVASLESGQVELCVGEKVVALRPGEEGEVDRETGVTEVRKADFECVLAWKRGEFVYKNVRLEEIMKELEEWYGVQTVYGAEALKEEKYYMYVSRDKTLEEVLNRLTMTGHVNYRVEGEKIFIHK